MKKLIKQWFKILLIIGEKAKNKNGGLEITVSHALENTTEVVGESDHRCAVHVEK